MIAPKPAIVLRPATPDDLALLQSWGKKPHLIAAGINDLLGFNSTLGYLSQQRL